MENVSPKSAATAVFNNDPPESPSPPSSGRKRSGSGGSILSKFPFLRTSESRSNIQEARLQHQTPLQQQPIAPEDASESPRNSPRLLAAAISQQQHKGRKRRGSLRKVALLGRGAARDRREKEAELSLGDGGADSHTGDKGAGHAQSASHVYSAATADASRRSSSSNDQLHGLGISGVSSGPSVSSTATTAAPDGSGRGTRSKSHSTSPGSTSELQLPSPSRSPTSTTDDEDILHMPASRDQSPAAQQLSSNSLASISSAFLAAAKHPHPSSVQRRRSNRTATSPLSLQGLTASPLPPAAEDHDYSETEWWGWVILVVTWFVFVVGMGSCFNTWSWAWDVGTTPWAPPELEDDPTLPIIGYYPALMILTAVMAWVWVTVAWVGMKYFRHAKMSGD